MHTLIALAAATLTWSPPTQNVAGDPIPSDDQFIASYELYISDAPIDANNKPEPIELDASVTTYVYEMPTPGVKYRFRIKAVDNNGRKSQFSKQVAKTAPTPPKPAPPDLGFIEEDE